MTTDVLGALRGSSFCRALGQAERHRLASIGRLRVVPTGGTLLREGEETLELGIVRRGRLALRLHVPERGPVTVLTVEPGDIYGWSAVVPPHRSTSTVIATEPTETIAFDAGTLRFVLETDDELSAALYPCLLRTVARRLDATRLQLLDVFAAAAPQPW